MNPFRKLVLETYRTQGRDATIDMIEAAGLGIPCYYDSFFKSLDEELARL